MSGILLASVGNSYGAPPVNTVAPAVTGTASFGSTLTTTDGTWTGLAPITFTYQWQRTSVDISGATSSTYTLVAADVGNTIRCVVKATNSVAPSGVTANSNSTASVAAIAPGAPTIGTATSTGTTTATVVFTQPASNGGATITSYTATSSPSGITGTLSQAGSGTITVSGLTSGTSYTFTVTATNSAGTSSASSASNSITTTPVIGQAFGGGYYAGQIGVSGVATHYLVTGPKSSAQGGSTYTWKNVNTDTPGTTSDIDGPTNSANMNSYGNSNAAAFAEGLSIGGYTDWYLPAQNELEVCYYNLKPTTTSNSNYNTSGINANAVPPRASVYTAGTPAQTSVAAFQSPNSEAYTASSNYWCSTQFNATKARAQSFSNGRQGYYYSKTSAYFVRGIRRVAV